jgi:pimeloyl-ACP methyl ester carboxylesterase
VTLTTVDQVSLRGTFFPSRKEKEAPCVLLLHDLRQTRKAPGWERLATTLQREGYAVLTLDFRGFGESRNVGPAFRTFPHNQRLGRRGDELNGAAFPEEYRPFLVNDLATARAYLDELNNAGKLNANSLVIIGAGQGAAVGMLWMASECCRFASTPDARTVRTPEARNLACAVWLGFQPLLNKARALPYKQWLELTGAELIPMAFACDPKDQAGRKLAGTLARDYRSRRMALNLGSLLLLGDPDSETSGLPGQGDADPAKLVDYVNRTVRARRNRPWTARDLENATFHYVIGGHWVTNPFSGQLTFVPIDRLVAGP